MAQFIKKPVTPAVLVHGEKGIIFIAVYIASARLNQSGTKRLYLQKFLCK